MVKNVLIFLISLSVCFNSFSMVANPFLKQVKQPDGKVVKVHYVGNEWKHYLIDESGNILERDKKGFWVKRGSYRDVLSKKPSSPRVFNDFKNQKEGKGLSEFIYKRMYNDFLKKGYSFESSNFKGNTKGSFNHPVLVILVEFSNFSHVATTPSDWANSFFSDKGKTVKNYYKEVSYGKVNIVPVSDSFGESDGVVGWITLPYNHPDTGNSITLDNLRIASDAIKKADKYVDFSKYDKNWDGVISVNELSIFIVVAGYECSYSPQYHPSIWGHKAALYPEYGYPGVLCDGVLVGEYSDNRAKTGGYMEIGEWQQSNENDGHKATIGIMCHELAHDMFGIIDLYDTDYSSQGIGCFGLMGAGSWGMAKDDSFPGETPVHFCAWSKIFCGFLSPQTVFYGDVTVNSIEDNQDIKKILTPESGEYFLVSNRQQKGFDRGLYAFFGEDGGGLAVWHIIDKAYNNNLDFYRKVDLISARRCGDMLSWYDLGKREDLFFEGNNTSLTPDTIPSSNISNGVDSRVKLTDISNSSDEMSFKLSYTSPVFSTLNYKANSWSGVDDYSYLAIDRERGLVFALNMENGVQIYRINEDKFIPVSKIDSIGLFVRCRYKDGYLYVIDAKGRALIYNISDENNPYLVSQIDYGHQSMDLIIRDNYLYISVGDGFLIVDISDKSNPSIVYENYSLTAVLDIALKGDALYVTSYSGRFIQNPERGVLVFNVQDKGNPHFVTRLDTGDDTRCAIVYGNYLFAGEGPDYLYDISNPLNPVFVKRLKIHGTFWRIFGQDLLVSTYGDVNGTLRCYDLSTIPDVPLKWSVFQKTGCFAEFNSYLIYENSYNNSLDLCLLKDFEWRKVMVDKTVLGDYSFLRSTIKRDGDTFFRNDTKKTYGVKVNGDSFSDVKEIPFEQFFVKNGIFYSFEYSDGGYFFKVFEGNEDLTKFEYLGKGQTDFNFRVLDSLCAKYNNLLFVPGVNKDENGDYYYGVDVFDVYNLSNPVKLSTISFEKNKYISGIAYKNNFLYIVTEEVKPNNTPDTLYLYTISMDDLNNPVVIDTIELNRKDGYLNFFPVYFDFVKGKLLLARCDAAIDVFKQNSDGTLIRENEIDLSNYSFNGIYNFDIDGDYAYIGCDVSILKADISDLNNFKIVKQLPLPYSDFIEILNRDYIVSIIQSWGEFFLIDRNAWESDLPVLDRVYADYFISDYCIDGGNVFYVTSKSVVKLKINGDSIDEEKRASILPFNDISMVHSRSTLGQDSNNVYVLTRGGQNWMFSVFRKSDLSLVSQKPVPENSLIEESEIFGRDLYVVVKEDGGYYLKHYQADYSYDLSLKGSVKLNDRRDDFFISMVKKGNYIVLNNFFEDLYVVKTLNNGNLSLVNTYKREGFGFLRVRGDYLLLCGYGIKLFSFNEGELNKVDCIFDNFSADDAYFDGNTLVTVFKNIMRFYNFDGGRFYPAGSVKLNDSVDTNYVEKVGDKFLLFDLVHATRIWVVKECDKPVISSFNSDKSRGAVPLIVNFEANLESYPENSVFQWDFDGDGEIDLQTQTPVADYTYLKEGHYSPCLIVKTPDGNEIKSEKLAITVYSDKPLTIPLNFGNWYNKIKLVLINNEDSAINLNVALKDGSGNEIESRSVEVGGMGRCDLDFTATDGFIEITGEGNYSAYVYLEGENKKSSAVADRCLGSTLIIPHIAEESNFWDSIVAFSSFKKEDFRIETSCSKKDFNGFSNVMNVEDLLSGDCADYQKGWGKLNLFGNNPLSDEENGAGFEFFVKNNSDGAGFSLNSEGNNTLIIPHIPDERDIFWTGIVIDNLSNRDNEILFHFYYKNGMPLDIDYSYTLKPYEKLKRTIAGLFPDLPEGVVSCVVEGELPLTGCEIYGTFDAGIAGFPLDFSKSTEGAMPVVKGDNLWNGIAVFNSLNKGISLTLKLYSKDGTLKDERAIELLPYEHRQFVLSDIFQIEKGDTLRFSSDLPVSFIEVQGDKGYKTMNALRVK
ncbi:hypothetical protein TTHT_0379 [Thermotomaculum hydrothermale]|uniref:M6 family metalloprotease domain protein n=1 Tax=Thermotomaculum hydrothermale TaxID=981385 RepID=A0A7R6PYK0_9BACT|nr:M6 family metalloprotease domain-containing protein [Thermotomaculum hydrothermale]BBB31993.1 hypothetical protein TTHT_0379 [Thermotomaculum hydrothermale]